MKLQQTIAVHLGSVLRKEWASLHKEAHSNRLVCLLYIYFDNRCNRKNMRNSHIRLHPKILKNIPPETFSLTSAQDGLYFA